MSGLNGSNGPSSAPTSGETSSVTGSFDPEPLRPAPVPTLAELPPMDWREHLTAPMNVDSPLAFHIQTTNFLLLEILNRLDALEAAAEARRLLDEYG